MTISWMMRKALGRVSHPFVHEYFRICPNISESEENQCSRIFTNISEYFRIAGMQDLGNPPSEPGPSMHFRCSWWECFFFLEGRTASPPLTTPTAVITDSNLPHPQHPSGGPPCQAPLHWDVASHTSPQERPSTEVVFVSACAPDFREPHDRLEARREMQHYFVPPNKCGTWRCHPGYHGRVALMQRLQGIWSRFFKACQEQEVTHPSLIPMGLGVMRPRVGHRPGQERREEQTALETDVTQLYFEAQLTVLETDPEGFGFHTVFLNPRRFKAELLHVLSRKRWKFRFHLQVRARLPGSDMGTGGRFAIY